MRSLRNRALFGGILWAFIIMAIGGFALFSYFAAASLRQFDEKLVASHLQLVVALTNAGGQPERIAEFLTDPAYDRVYSGSYWQVVGPEAVIVTSASLFDTILPIGEEMSTERTFWNDEGPKSNIRGIHQRIQLPDGSHWFATVAQTLDALRDQQQAIRQSLVSTLGLIGVLGVAAAVFLTSAIVRPLNRLREEVSHRWDSGQTLSPKDYPEEVEPLVNDINTLLERNHDIVDRARRQTADMAHALNTPSAILRNELNGLAQEGVNVERAQEALEKIDAQIKRSLARIRASNAASGLGQSVSLKKSVARMARLFDKMHGPEAKQIDYAGVEDVQLMMDIQDLEEILGNIIENAFKHADERIRISTERLGSSAVILIEDDGPGIAPEKRAEAMRSGGRLDTSVPGTGLGLAIAQDLVRAYGGLLALDVAQDLGGLKVSCTIPSAPAASLV